MSRPTCRRSARRLATGAPGRRGRLRTAATAASRSTCGCGAASRFSRSSVPAATAPYGDGRLTTDVTNSTNFNTAYHFLNPQPRDLTTAAFKSRTTPSGALPTDEDIFRTITRGVRRGQIMPAWGNAADGHMLPEQDRWDLVDYVKTLSPRFKIGARTGANPDSRRALRSGQGCTAAR